MQNQLGLERIERVTDDQKCSPVFLIDCLRSTLSDVYTCYVVFVAMRGEVERGREVY